MLINVIFCIYLITCSPLKLLPFLDDVSKLFYFSVCPIILVCNAHFSRLSQILMDKINSRPFFVCFWNMSHYVSKIGCKLISG